jgi:LmbE family N-acetylglucosaminyl deacetylase
MAHPDDAELWAGGTLTRHAQAGARITIALPPCDHERALEAAAGADILGATLRLLDVLNVPAVQALLEHHRPDVLITHNPDDIHPDHQMTARTTLAALPTLVIATGRPQRVYTCDGYNNLDHAGTPLNLPTIVDVTDTWHTKKAALAAHHTQPVTDHFGPMAETLGRLHGRRIQRPYAEAFRPAPVLGRLPPTHYL